MDDDNEDDDSFGLKCDACGGGIDEGDPEQFFEAAGWYTCPHCGNSNVGD